MFPKTRKLLRRLETTPGTLADDLGTTLALLGLFCVGYLLLVL